MRRYRTSSSFIRCLPVLLIVSIARAAPPGLTVEDVLMAAGAEDAVVVHGNIDGDMTYGVTIIVEISPRVGNQGSVRFTPAPPDDIDPLVDPWPDAGTFTSYDTDISGTPLLNACVDDNETFVAEPLTFSDALARFPIVASADAAGIWDVELSTSEGDSGWAELATTLVAGTVTVPQTGPPIPAASTWGLVIIAIGVMSIGTVSIRLRDPPHTVVR